MYWGEMCLPRSPGVGEPLANEVKRLSSLFLPNFQLGCRGWGASLAEGGWERDTSLKIPKS